MAQRGGYRRTPAKMIESAERRRRVLELRKKALTFDAIAKLVGLGSRQAAQQAYKRAIAEITREPAEEARTLELERTDRMLRGLIKKGAFDGDTTAVLAMCRVLDRRAKYLGLDAPVKIDAKVDVDTTDSHDELLGRVARLAAALAGGAGHPKLDA